jgi:hypothetical protein
LKNYISAKTSHTHYIEKLIPHRHHLINLHWKRDHLLGQVGDILCVRTEDFGAVTVCHWVSGSRWFEGRYCLLLQEAFYFDCLTLKRKVPCSWKILGTSDPVTQHRITENLSSQLSVTVILFTVSHKLLQLDTWITSYQEIKKTEVVLKATNIIIMIQFLRLYLQKAELWFHQYCYFMISKAYEFLHL